MYMYKNNSVRKIDMMDCPKHSIEHCLVRLFRWENLVLLEYCIYSIKRRGACLIFVFFWCGALYLGRRLFETQSFAMQKP